jgi:uncharacterized protein GlcG (DUF336 family)
MSRVRMTRLAGAGVWSIAVLGAISAALAQSPAAPAAAVAPAAPGAAVATYSQLGQPLVASAANQPPAPAAPGPSLEVSLEAAQLAVKTCKGLDQDIGVSIVDSAGIPKVVLAADGASSRGVQSSTNKALTALAFKLATSALGEKIKTDSNLAARVAANPTYNKNAGGLLITHGADIIGAVGVGGAKGSEKDEACAKAALDKLWAAGPR